MLVPDDSLGIAGGLIGSSVRLRAECERLANVLGFPPELQPESPELESAIDEDEPAVTGWQRYAVQTHVCVVLLRACEHSIRTGAAIVFG